MLERIDCFKWGGAYPANISLHLAHFCHSHIVYGKLRISFLKKEHNVLWKKEDKGMLFWMRMRAARNWQHPAMNQYRCSLKTTSLLLWAHHQLDVYSMLLDFFLPVCKRNNTFIVLFRQNAFDLLVALGRLLAGGLNLLSSHGGSNSQGRPDISHSSASGAADVTGFQREFA